MNAHSRSHRFLASSARLLLLVLLCTTLALFRATPVCAAHLPLKAYTVADGLPHNTINCIVRDSRGFLWFCTAEGLSLFDGYRFTNFGVDQGLPNPHVTAIVETREGEYWVATLDGLCKLDPRGIAGRVATSAIGTAANAVVHPMFTVFRPEGGDHRASAFTALLEGRDGTIWCGTRNGLYRLARVGGVVQLQPIHVALPTSYAEGRFINALLEDRYGTLWVGAASGLCRRWPDGSATRYSRATGLPDDYVHALLADRDGHVWVGTRYGGLLELATDASRPPAVTRAYNRANGFIADWIFAVNELEDGRLWVGTNTGLAEFSADDRKRDTPSHVYGRNNGFIYHEIAIVSEDRDGNIWLGTVNGAMKLARNGFLSFGQEDGIVTATPLFELDRREMYFSGYVPRDPRARLPPAGQPPPAVVGQQQYLWGIGRFDGEGFTWLRPTAVEGRAISWSAKQFVTRTRAGDWWIGRFLFRVSSFSMLENARPAAEYTTTDGLASPVVHSLFEDSRGDVWISTMSPNGNGLARWNHVTRTVQDMARREGLPPLKDRLPCAFEEDRSGGVWIGFEQGGVARYAADRFRLFTTAEGLPGGEISDLHVDRGGRLWVGTAGRGLARVDDPSATRPAFVVYSAVQGLSSNTVTAITDDLYGRIYVATGRGLDRFSPSTGQVRHFTSADGLPPGEVHVAYREDDGALWFGTRSGLLRYVPEPERPSRRPSVFITALRIAGEKRDISALGETEITLPDLDADRNHVQLDFVALSFAAGETMRYEYKLVPGDNWSAPSDQRTLNFANLAPGSYQFLVRAITSDGVLSAIPASLTFTVLGPVWQRWWFRSLGTLLAGLIAYSLYRHRLARLLELERVRTRIATDLHDEIGTNLSLIAMVSEVANRTATQRDPQVAGWLSLIASTSRETVDAMSDIVWAVNPNRDRLGDLTQRMRRVADDRCSAANIALEFVAPADESGLTLAVDTRRELFLIFKEAMNNIVRHAHCTEARIDLRLEDRGLQLRLSDNGRGFDVSSATTGDGLASMRRRAEQLGGELDIVSAANGTTITLRAPIGSSRRRSPR